MPGYYERSPAHPTGSATSEIENGGSNAASSMEGSSADVVHVDVTSVTKPGVNPSSMLISVTQLGTVLEPAIMGNLVLPKSTPIIKESNPLLHLLFWWRD